MTYARETRMLRHLLSSDRKTRLYSYYVKTILFAVLLSTSAGAGDLSGDLSTNNENSTVDSNNSDTTNNYNATGAGSAAPVMSAIAPTMMGGGGNDSCLLPSSTGIQISVIGISRGAMQQDEACNRRKNARLLGAPQQVGGLGLQVSAISILCQDPVVFRSMMLANTPCPINDSKTGKLLMGKAAIKKYRESPALYIVGYETDQMFWDTLLRVGEEDTDEETVEDDTPKLSLSERFRSSKRRDN
tara:strand:+ start:4290 stop:5021 length:732 start_codon:yes stop_codon:yes gene_type:complete